MRRTITTFILLLSLFLCALYLSRLGKEGTVSYTEKPVINTNQYVEYVEKDYRQEIEKYRIGQPRFYDNPNYPYSNPYRKHPVSFIPGYRQPIDGLVPDDYTSTLESSNLMFPSMKPGCKDQCMDMEKGYFSDLLNTE
jgi:hypothetical protein